MRTGCNIFVSLGHNNQILLFPPLIAEDLKYDSSFHIDMQKAKHWHGKNEPKINQEYHTKITPAKFNCFYV